MQGERADARVELAGVVAVAVAAPVSAAFVGFGVQMRRHLGFEHRLDDALDEDTKKVMIVRQDRLCCCRDAGTLSVCHCVPPSIRSGVATDRGGQWLP